MHFCEPVHFTLSLYRSAQMLADKPLIELFEMLPCRHCSLRKCNAGKNRNKLSLLDFATLTGEHLLDPNHHELPRQAGERCLRPRW